MIKALDEISDAFFYFVPKKYEPNTYRNAETKEKTMITIENVRDLEANNEELIVKATVHAKIGTKDILNTFETNGLIGVYNLGMQHMLDYLMSEKEIPKNHIRYILDETHFIHEEGNKDEE